MFPPMRCVIASALFAAYLAECPGGLNVALRPSRKELGCQRLGHVLVLLPPLVDLFLRHAIEVRDVTDHC